MDDFLRSITEWIKERTTSPLYGTFIFSVILWNWKFFYILFWQSEDKLLLPRIEYVQQNILACQSIWYHLLFFLFLPIVSTLVILLWLPILNNFFHKIYIDFYYQKKFIIDDAQLKYEQKEKERLIAISEIKKDQVEVKKEIEKKITDVWELEFESFKTTPFYSKMSDLKRIIYDNSGLTRKWSQDRGYVLLIDANVLAFADINNLIKITGKEAEEKIEFTPKGKFYLAKFLRDNQP